MVDLPPPTPWFPHGLPDHDLAAVVAAIQRHGRRLLHDFPPLPLPRTGVGGIVRSEFTTATLLATWEGAADLFTGACPVCGGRLLGTSAAALGGLGRITGLCCSCGIPLVRAATVEEVLSLAPADARRVESEAPAVAPEQGWIDSDSERDRIHSVLLYGVDPASWDPSGCDDWQPLLAALRQLGEGGLVPPCGAGVEWWPVSH